MSGDETVGGKAKFVTRLHNIPVSSSPFFYVPPLNHTQGAVTLCFQDAEGRSFLLLRHNSPRIPLLADVPQKEILGLGKNKQTILSGLSRTKLSEPFRKKGKRWKPKRAGGRRTPDAHAPCYKTKGSPCVHGCVSQKEKKKRTEGYSLFLFF